MRIFSDHKTIVIFVVDSGEEVGLAYFGRLELFPDGWRETAELSAEPALCETLAAPPSVEQSSSNWMVYQ